MKKIVLINPRTFPTNFHPPNVNNIPLELITIASYIPSDYNIKIIDLSLINNVQAMKKKIKKELDESVICVGFTVMTDSLSPSVKFSKFIKKHSKAPIVWGGIHPTLMPKETLEEDYVDMVVIGDGEITFPELLYGISKKSKLSSIKGIGFKQNKKIIINERRPFFDLNKSKIPRYDLINLNNYQKKNTNWIIIQFSRGCPHNCSFCFNKAYNRDKFRIVNHKNAIKHIDYAYNKLKIRNIMIADDHLFVDIDNTTKIFEEILKRKYKINIWKVSLRIDIGLKLKDYHYRLMEKIGIRILRFGAESGSDKTLRSINKKISVAEIRRLNLRLKKYNLRVTYSFVIGFPNESKKERKKTINFVFKLIEENPNSTIIQIFALKLDPMSDIYIELKKKGYKVPVKIDDWIKVNYHNFINSKNKNHKGSIKIEDWMKVGYHKYWLSKKEINDMMAIYTYSTNYNLLPGKEKYIKRLLVKIFYIIVKFRIQNLYFKNRFDLKIKNYLWGKL
ncbi:B12-binding domain-containing radical SAM protein [Candidatus Woesearchaeota archaeon]|jgi:anaerobic magnesium-protoporphyrin IX monomethyl ester cyclase|nr:B12-binding domain-containing radical SAM protein [Candidatus Woesearchaeota archaeon]